MKNITFTVIAATSSDQLFPSSNLQVLSTNPVGWMSARFCTYPQEVILQFQSNIFVQKLQILSHENKISQKAEVFVGKQLKPQRDFASFGVDSISFQRIGYFTFQSNESSGWKARELKTVTIEQSNCNFMKVLLHKYYENRYNPFGQVGIVAIRVYGEMHQLAPPSR